jgi:hypothetical protein
MLVHINSTTWQHIPEDCIHNVHQCENLVSHAVYRLFVTPVCPHAVILGYLELLWKSNVYNILCNAINSGMHLVLY